MTFGDVHKTALRLPRPLHERIHRAAAANGRTMNAEIVARLTALFEAAGDVALLDQLTPAQKAALRLVLEKVLPTV